MGLRDSPALPLPHFAWLGSEGTETGSRLSWARRAWSRRDAQGLRWCCQTLRLSGRRHGSNWRYPQLLGWPWSRLDFNLLGHQACWDWRAGGPSRPPDKKPSKVGLPGPVLKLHPRSFCFLRVGISPTFAQVVPLSLGSPLPYLGRARFPSGHYSESTSTRKPS